MADFQPFNLGQVLQTAEAIKAARAQSTTDRLREQYLGEQIQASRDARDRQQRMDQITFGKQKAAEAYNRITRILQSPSPKDYINQAEPELATQLQRQGLDWATASDDQLRHTLQMVADRAGAEAGIDPGNLSDREKLTLQSQIEDKRIAGQQRFQAGMQANQQQFSAAQAEQARQAQVAAMERQQAFTADQNRQEREARAALNGPNSAQAVTERQRTLDVYTQARNGLIQALNGTETGPVAGRVPSFTTEQQVGEGAVAAMAPVLKQLFRSAGEGTFTDRDQELLLRMVPTRLDRPEARKQKLANIDRIISAKLGLPVPSYQESVAPQAGGASSGWTIEEVQ